MQQIHLVDIRDQLLIDARDEEEGPWCVNAYTLFSISYLFLSFSVHQYWVSPHCLAVTHRGRSPCFRRVCPYMPGALYCPELFPVIQCP